MSEDDQKDIDVDIPHGKFRARGYDILTIAVVAGLSTMLYMLFDHTKMAERASNDASVNAKDAASNAKETSRAIREMTCVLSLDANQRMDQIGRSDSYCKRMAQ